MVAFRNDRDDFNGSARSHIPTTPQSTSDRVGAVGIDRGMAWRLRLEKGRNGVLGSLVGVESGGISR